MDIKALTIAGLACTAMLVAIAGTVQLPQLIVVLLFLLLGLGLTILGAAYLKNLQTLNLQGRVISGIEALHLQSSQKEAGECLFKILEKMFPRAQLCIYPFTETTEPISRWEKAPEIARRCLKEGRPLIIKQADSDIKLPAGIENLAVVPMDRSSSQCLFVYNIPPHIGPRNLQIALEVLLKHMNMVFERAEYREQEQMQFEILLGAAVQALESNQDVFIGHARRVAHISRLIGQGLGMSSEELRELVYSALLHDIGRGIASQEDQAEMDHASLGQLMIPVTPSLAAIKSAIYHHHERYDGSGYPLGLKHTDIPLAARIIAVADMYDALTALAPDEDRCEHHQALQIIKKAIGTQFDPLVVVAFEEVAWQLEQDTQ
ncbi:MAG: HD domain-containing protein [Syntrophomonadaceae bacterium]|jgi:hypothetical protein|nr:HD domain-containing protein [Syntrophomonadaceae bacterium]